MSKLFAQVTKPENGYQFDEDRARALIRDNSKEHLFEVTGINIGRSDSSVYLKDLPGYFNSVNFSFFIKVDDGRIKEYDILVNSNNLDLIRHTYRICFK